MKVNTYFKIEKNPKIKLIKISRMFLSLNFKFRISRNLKTLKNN